MKISTLLFRASLTMLLFAAGLPGIAQEAKHEVEQPKVQSKALRLITKIDAPEMTGTWDHLTVDAVGKRLFASAQEDHVVRVFDLVKNIATDRIAVGFNRPQGLYYAPNDRLFVSNGRDGALKIVDGKTLQLLKSVPLSLGADMMAYDDKTGQIFVEHGGVDSKRGPGSLTVLDTKTLEIVGDVPTEMRAAAMAPAEKSMDIYVAMPTPGEVAVIDRTKREIVQRFALMPKANPVAVDIDEKSRRIFAGTRLPDEFAVLNMDTGAMVFTSPTVGGIEGCYFDAKHKRIYISGLDGIVEIFQQKDADHYVSLGRVSVVPHAGTSIWVPSLNRYYVAAPPEGATPGQIWVFEPQ